MILALQLFCDLKNLFPNRPQARQNPRIHFYAIPQILNPQTFILRLLIIIVIDHGHDNQRGLQNPVEDEKGQTATGGRHFYDWLAER